MSAQKKAVKTKTKAQNAVPSEPINEVQALDKSALKTAIVKHLHSSLGTDENKANNHAWWKATCAAIQELVLEGLRKTQKSHYFNDTRAVHYFSAEFLMGRLLSNNMHNLDLTDPPRADTKNII